MTVISKYPIISILWLKEQLKVEDFLTRGLAISTFAAIIDLDPRAYIPFIVGAVSGYAIHLSAKALYDSGLTKPIYKVLRIQDRRLLPV